MGVKGSGVEEYDDNGFWRGGSEVEEYGIKGFGLRVLELKNKMLIVLR